MDTFVTSISQFDAKSSQIQDLAVTISQIKTALKRKFVADTSADVPITKKQTPNVISDDESSDEEMGVLMGGKAVSSTENQPEQDFLDEINEFFVPEDQLNPPVQEE